MKKETLSLICVIFLILTIFPFASSFEILGETPEISIAQSDTYSPKTFGRTTQVSTAMPEVGWSQTNVNKCNIFSATENARLMLEEVRVLHSAGRTTVRSEIRTINAKTRQISHSTRASTDFQWREVPLVLLNTKTCKLRIITPIRSILPTSKPEIFLLEEDIIIEVEKRAYGENWNGFNTPFVITPDEWIVVAMAWKSLSSGNVVVYTPFSEQLVRHYPELVEAGIEHLSSDFANAIQSLENLGVGSTAFPGERLSDIAFRYYTQLLINLVLSEQTDQLVFVEWLSGSVPYDPFDRVLAIFGANGDRAYAATRSPRGAMGMMQIMPATCTGVQRIYPRAKLPSDCGLSDTHNHVMNIMTAILVVDDMVRHLMIRLGPKVVERRDFVNLVASSYNYGPGRVALLARSNQQGWHKNLPSETVFYLEKLDSLQSRAEFSR